MWVRLKQRHTTLIFLLLLCDRLVCCFTVFHFTWWAAGGNNYWLRAAQLIERVCVWETRAARVERVVTTSCHTLCHRSITHTPCRRTGRYMIPRTATPLPLQYHAHAVSLYGAAYDTTRRRYDTTHRSIWYIALLYMIPRVAVYDTRSSVFSVK